MTKVPPPSMDEPAGQEEDKSPGRRKALVVLANGGLLLAGTGGVALLARWALSFHRSNEQLWMVPVGLVLLGTPLVAWLSVFATGFCRRLETMVGSEAAVVPPPSLNPEREIERGGHARDC